MNITKIKNENSNLNRRLISEYISLLLDDISKIINEKSQIRFSRWHDLFKKYPSLDIVELSGYFRFWEKIKR